MSSNLKLPPLGAMPPAVQTAFQAIDSWSRAQRAEIAAIQQSAELLKKDATRMQVLANAGPGSQAPGGVMSPTEKRINDDRIVRSILQNSAIEAPIEMNASVVFKAGHSTTGVGIGAGGVIGWNTIHQTAEYDGFTFGLSAEDGSFFFGAEDWAPGVTDRARKQIIFDAATNTIQFGSDIIIKRSSGDSVTLDEVASDGYTADDLASDLASGVESVLAGVGGDYRMDIDAALSRILFMHKDFQYTAGDPYFGTLRTALAITSNGIAMGHQSKTTGAFVPSVAIDGVTGNASFSGAVSATSGNFAQSITIGGITIGGSAATLGQIANLAINGNYTKAKLEADLGAGVAHVVAGLGLGYGMKVEHGGVYFYRDGAVYNGYSGVADTTNITRPMLAVTANGIAMGYNNTAGNWVNSVAIDSNGNATFLGTVSADSIISVNAICNGQTLGAIQSNANFAASGLADKLNKNAADILSGQIEFQTSGGFKTGTITIASDGTASGAGVAITSKGIVGRTNSATTFAINATTGAATFAGQLVAATGTFTGAVYAQNDAVFSMNGNPVAVWGKSTQFTGVGVVGQNTTANGMGGYFEGAVGVLGRQTDAGGYGVYCQGRLGVTDSTLVSNLKAHYLGYGGNSYQLRGGSVTGSATATFSGVKPGSEATNSWLQINIDGANYYIPIWSA